MVNWSPKRSRITLRITRTLSSHVFQCSAVYISPCQQSLSFACSILVSSVKKKTKGGSGRRVFIFINEIQGKAFVIHLSFGDRNRFYIDYSSIVNVSQICICLRPRGHRVI